MRGLSLLTIILFAAACGEEGSGVKDLLPGPDVADDTRSADLLPDTGGDTLEEVQTSDTAIDSVDSADEPLRPVVFAVVSDIHVNGAPGTPIATNAKLLMNRMNSLEPPPEIIAITGDLTDTLYEPVDTSSTSRIEALKQALDVSKFPVEMVLGNHDYYFEDDPQFILVSDRSARDELFEQQFGIKPWSVARHGGMKFIYINTMQGELWNISMGLNGSAGQEQLSWLNAELADGTPSVVFMHHPPSTVIEPEGQESIEDVIVKHSNVMAIFAGHVHLWVRSNEGAVPVYLTGAGYDGKAWHHVKVDPIEGTVSILNEGSIDYGELETPECDPETHPAIANTQSIEGSVLEVVIKNAVAEPAGFGTYLEEAVKMVPLVFLMGEMDPSGLAWSAHLGSGGFISAPGGYVPPYVTAIDDGPCLLASLAMSGSCFSTAPLALTIDLAASLGINLPSGHYIRVKLKDLVFSGALTSGPAMTDGLMSATIDLATGVEDLRALVVEQYCGSKISGCAPGSGALPSCPPNPDTSFFPEIPVTCDVKVGSIGVRMVLALMEGVPDYLAYMDAGFTTWTSELSESSSAGKVHPDLFWCAE